MFFLGCVRKQCCRVPEAQKAGFRLTPCRIRRDLAAVFWRLSHGLVASSMTANQMVTASTNPPWPFRRELLTAENDQPVTAIFRFSLRIDSPNLPVISPRIYNRPQKSLPNCPTLSTLRPTFSTNLRPVEGPDGGAWVNVPARHRSCVKQHRSLRLRHWPPSIQHALPSAWQTANLYRALVQCRHPRADPRRPGLSESAANDGHRYLPQCGHQPVHPDGPPAKRAASQRTQPRWHGQFVPQEPPKR